MRRPPRVVLWGGRPDVDIQFGSRADRRRARLLRIDAAFARAGRILSDFIAEAGHAVQRAVTVLERSGLGQTARALRAQAEDERRMAARENAGILQQRPPRVTALKMTSEQSAKAFLRGRRGQGPPYADPPGGMFRDDITPTDIKAPAGKLYAFEEGSLKPYFYDEWPETEADQLLRWVAGDDTAIPDAQKHSHTFHTEWGDEPITYTGAAVGEITIDVDPDAFGRYLHAMTWPFAVNMGWVAPLGPGGCRHPASAHAILADCPGWRWCADCGTTLNPTQAGACT